MYFSINTGKDAPLYVSLKEQRSCWIVFDIPFYLFWDFFIEGFPCWRCNWSNWLCSGERLRILSEILRGRGRNNDKYYYKRRRHHKVSGKIGISSFSFRFLFYYFQEHLLNITGVYKTECYFSSWFKTDTMALLQWKWSVY